MGSSWAYKGNMVKSSSRTETPPLTRLYLVNPGVVVPRLSRLVNSLVIRWRRHETGWSMRRRLRNFLPIVLMALMVQILAPIAACWAAGIVASDPLANAAICHDSAASASDSGNQTDPGGNPHVHDGACCLVCGGHIAASLDAPPQLPVSMPYRSPPARRLAQVRAGTARCSRRRACPGSGTTRTLLTLDISAIGRLPSADNSGIEQAGFRASVRILRCFGFMPSAA